MTNDLKALAERTLALAEKATRGEWAYDAAIRFIGATHPQGGKETVCEMRSASGYNDDNAAFIALSRTAAPALAREVLRLLERAEKAEALVREITTRCRWDGVELLCGISWSEWFARAKAAGLGAKA